MKKPKVLKARVQARKTTTSDLISSKEVDADVSFNPKWSWHYRKLKALWEKLVTKRASRLQDAAEPMERHSLNPADSATDEFDHDMAVEELSAEQATLFEVEAALLRIMEGRYGICELSGQPIPPARLKAIPWTRYSQNSARLLEKPGATSSRS